MPTAEIEPAGWYEQRIDALIRTSPELVAEIGRLRASNHELARELTAAAKDREALRERLTEAEAELRHANAEVRELRERIERKSRA
jgi:predicted  nucleic acid-binding Zn-ribbon protein